jgi:transcriptional regulator with GAF, ATPase, and Fis domain
VEIKSGLGNSSPRYLILVPLIYQKKLFGVLEIASFKKIEKHHIEFVEKVGENIAASLLTTKINQQTQTLLKESTDQSERLAQQEEEMRQNMEELMATQEEMNRKDREQQAEIAELKERLSELEGGQVEEEGEASS